MRSKKSFCACSDREQSKERWRRSAKNHGAATMSSRRSSATLRLPAMLRTRRFGNTTPPTQPIVWLRQNWSSVGTALSSVSRSWKAESRNTSARPPTTAPTSPEQFATLAVDLKAVWRDPTADVRLKKRIVRELIREVIADLDEQGGEIILVVHWMGGVHTELRLPRRRRGSATVRRRKS